jgi:cephalosporin hydroxylase
LDHEIILKYVRYLVTNDTMDTSESRLGFCREETIHPKLLYYNPHIKSVENLFQDKSNFERLMDMNLREWMNYHYYYIHQGYRYGAAELQQQWLGHDIIKTPFDCCVYQELIHKIKPDYIVELGVMFGGSTHFYASICDIVGHGTVVGIDITLSKVKKIDNQRICLVEGSSVSEDIYQKVKEIIGGGSVMVVADSDHEKSHVLKELKLYSQLVSVGSYYIVEDSLNDVMGFHPVPNEGPLAAAKEFLAENDSFVIDRRIGEKYLLTTNPSGYLMRVK